MTDAFRIIDANVNRAREALRVMEEYARFVLDDAALSSAIKQARHDLAGAIDPSLGASLVRRREITTDVGRGLTTEAEGRRDSAVDVVIAAAKRLSEALRVLEEYVKTIDPALAAKMEALRYAGYELERRLLITGQARARFEKVRLYVLITESFCRGDWLATAEAVLRGGTDCVQLREKDLPDRELLKRGKRLVKLSHEHGALAIINDRVDIAAASGADGVHLGQDDLPIAAARRILPPGAIVGMSTHTQAQIVSAIGEAPDYLAVGPMFATPTKPQDHIAGIETLAFARSQTSIPLVAIGGITQENVQQVTATAACRVCVCSALLGAADAYAACASLVRLLALPFDVPPTDNADRA